MIDNKLFINLFNDVYYYEPTKKFLRTRLVSQKMMCEFLREHEKYTYGTL